jgi:AcrR family transcriptional regulator
MNVEEKITKEELVKRFRTEGILTATRRVIAEVGIEKLTLERVAEAAGISKGTIYLYFKNKHDMVITLIEQMIEDSYSELSELLDGERSALAKLDDYIRFAFDRHLANEDLIFLLANEINLLAPAPDSEELRRLLASRERFDDLMVELISAGQREGVIADFSPRTGAIAFSGIIEAWVRHKLTISTDISSGEMAEQLREFFFRGIRK